MIIVVTNVVVVIAQKVFSIKIDKDRNLPIINDPITPVVTATAAMKHNWINIETSESFVDAPVEVGIRKVLYMDVSVKN